MNADKNKGKQRKNISDAYDFFLIRVRPRKSAALFAL